jgi:capsule polysaccharide export protein KpsE/RkpR
MDKERKLERTSISDYFYVLYKWKKFLIINLLVVSIITIVIVLLLPNKYKATAILMIPSDTQSAFGGLTGLLSGKSTLTTMGSKLFGITGTSEDVLLGILNSRTALTDIIKKFNLIDYYEISDNNIDKTIKAFRKDLSADPNEYGMIEISVINKDPKKAAQIANYIVSLVDSMNIVLNIQRAKNNREFIEQRYMKNLEDLRAAEDSLYLFQRKYGIVSVPEQLEGTFKAAAEVETQLLRKEIESYFLKQQYGESSPQFILAQQEINLLKKKVQEMKNSPELNKKSNILYAFKDMPNIAIDYLRIFREVEIQQALLEFIMPMYEQAKVEEQKSIPTVMIIDNAVPPQLKDSPKRTIIVLGIFLLFSFFLIPFVFVGENAISREEFSNPLQIKMKSFYQKLINFYKIKI